MDLSRTPRPLRVLGATLALALFVVGTDFCLISGVAAKWGARVPMSCLSAGPAGTSAHCAGMALPGGKSDPARGTRPATTAVSPCCVALVPVTAPGAAGPDAVALHAFVAVAATTMSAPVVAPASVVAPGAHDPPGSVPRALHGSRAPPLA